MTDRKKRIRLSLAVVIAVFVGLGAVAALSRGIEYVIAADIHPIITKPLDENSSLPKESNKSASPEKTPASDKTRSQKPRGSILGEYTTKFSSGAKARNENIRLAADALKGKTIQPGEVFSYNNTVGPTTKKNGYKRARIFVSGKKSYGYGGGVCQVSSTLFNAAELAGMEIIERHNHSLPVEYVPRGKDAATSHGSVDLKFKNTLSYPVKIDTGVGENAVTIQIVAA